MRENNRFFFILFLAVILLTSNFCIAQESKIFQPQGDYLVDSDFRETNIIEVQYNSTAYQQLLKNNPELQQYLDSNHNLKIKLNNQNIVITQSANVYQSSEESNEITNSVYAWIIIGILFIFLIAVIVLVIVSKIHKNQREE